MAIIDNTLAAQVPQFNLANTLQQGAQAQAAQDAVQAEQLKAKQNAVGAEMRGLTPFVNSPEFPQKWAQTMDNLLQRGVIDPQAHEQWSKSPSPLMMKSIIAKTDDPAMAQRKDEAAQAQKNSDRNYGLAVNQDNRAAAAANEAKMSLKEVTNPDGSTGFVRIKTIGPEGPVQGLTPPSASPSGAQLTGPDFLATLPPDQATIVKKIADHEVDPNKLSIVGGHRERLIAAASRYDPEYDASLAPARFAAKKEFLAGGPNSPAATIVSGGTTIGHLLHASDASQKLGGTSGFGPLNSIINKTRAGYEEQSNDPNFKEYNTTVGRIAEEGTKFYRGVGGTESDIMRDIKTMEPGQSQESRDRALATQASLIYSKVAALQDRYKNAMGTKAWDKIAKDNDFPVISAKNTEAVNTILKRGGLPPLPVAKSGQGNGADSILQHAKDAIAMGAPKEAVIQRLKESGIDPSGL